MNLQHLPIKGQQYSFEQYLEFVTQLVKDSQHSGQTEDATLKKFTVMNLERLQRIYKQFSLTEEEKETLSNITTQHWILIGESWCGDVSSSMPVIAKVAAHALDRIKLRIILRDQNPEVMDMYLPPTGGRSIPKLIIFNEKGEQIATWGSRPEKLNTLAVALKASNLPFIEVVNRVYAWYDLPENQHEISDEVLQLLF